MPCDSARVLGGSSAVAIPVQASRASYGRWRDRHAASSRGRPPARGDSSAIRNYAAQSDSDPDHWIARGLVDGGLPDSVRGWWKQIAELSVAKGEVDFQLPKLLVRGRWRQVSIAGLSGGEVPGRLWIAELSVGRWLGRVWIAAGLIGWRGAGSILDCRTIEGDLWGPRLIVRHSTFASPRSRSIAAQSEPDGACSSQIDRQSKVDSHFLVRRSEADSAPPARCHLNLPHQSRSDGRKSESGVDRSTTQSIRPRIDRSAIEAHSALAAGQLGIPPGLP
jgi:hypothetical protein